MPLERCLWTVLTPPGPGGIAVIALLGPDRHRHAATLLRGASGAACPVDRCPRLRRLWLGDAVIDTVLAFDLPDAERLEIHLHGSPAVIDALADALGAPRPWSPPPIDRLLATAATAAQLTLHAEQRRLLAPHGGFEAWLETIAGDRTQLAAAVARSRLALAVTTPSRLVLVGRQNAGKSTLMNRLLMQPRVLTGATPGLTRDPVGELVELGGYPYELVDTAGEGEVGDVAGEAAIVAGRRLRSGALCLHLIDGSVGPDPTDAAIQRSIAAGRGLVVATKADLAAVPWPPAAPPLGLRVTCLDPAAAPAVRRSIGTALRQLRGLPPAGGVGGVAAVDRRQLRQLLGAGAGRGPAR